jgi:hypothetical protein
MNELTVTEEQAFASFARMIAEEQGTTCAYEKVSEVVQRQIVNVKSGVLTWFAARVRLIAEIEREIESMRLPSRRYAA